VKGTAAGREQPCASGAQRGGGRQRRDIQGEWRLAAGQTRDTVERERANAPSTMMKVVSQPVPRPDWAPLTRPGCRGVEFKVVLQQPELVLAMLRFAPHSTIDEHPAPYPVDVICLDGEGIFSVDGEAAPLRTGESVQWPPTRPHCMWTESSEMMTLMVEHRDK